METKSHRTTILIDDDNFPKDDLKWLKLTGFKPTNLLRKKIREMREAEQEGNIDYKKANELLQNKISKICEVLEDVLPDEQFTEILQKI